jgi:competence protein ComEC
MMKNFRQNFKIYFLFLLVVINALIFYSVYYFTNPKLEVAFLDVGQGDAVFIKAPGGRQMLVDGGANNSVLRELGKVMPFYDRSIDVVLATHADQDHIGGLVEVLKRFKVDLLVRSNTTSTSAVYLELENLIKEKKIKEEIIMSPENIILGPGSEFDILFPTQNTAGWETNDASIVGKLVYGQNSFLLTGDSPQKIEGYLVGKYGSFLESDVLKAGHHGSKTSSSELFVGTVSPTYTVISVGLDNRYGHPSSEAVSIFTNFKSQILETKNEGMIKFESDGWNLIKN